MILFKVLGIVLTLFIILNGLYYLFFKQNKNNTSSILGILFLIFGTTGLFITISLL
jgi:hypothetical protein